MGNLQTQLAQLMQKLQLDDAPAGGSLVVYHKGELIAEANVGYAVPNMLWDKNTLSLNFSTGKGVLVTLIHVLVSQNYLNYELPIADYWPEFAENGKHDITLRQVLTHQAGLFNIQSVTDTADDMLDWDKMLVNVANMSPQTTANEYATSAYSALVSGWVLGGLIEKVMGEPLNQVIDKYLAEPLGVVGSLFFGVPRDKIAKVATLSKNFENFEKFIGLDIDLQSDLSPKQRSSKPILRSDSEKTLSFYRSLSPYPFWQSMYQQQHTAKSTLNTLDIANLYFDMSHVQIQDFKYALVPAGRSGFNYYKPDALMAKIPAANNVASAQALAKMYALLANGGKWHDKQIISKEVFEQLSKINVEGSDAIMPASNPNSMQWRLGYHRVFSLSQKNDNLKTAFGHMGYNGSMAWCDTKRELAVAFVHNFDVTMSTDIRQFAITETILDWFDQQ
ncbi:serine hydrolase domain-containing protein [Psychrobacter sp.]|uniref:serine hydrolase domain-containing protein n=1 Tax=Psychrobacter sp. TaxID=56811 RepID=UPI0025D5569B|nr:serine hydrolase domain-containing protein [Psychrobacter sp.]